MNILLVDDDVNVLESLQKGIDYKALGIDRVYAADTAMEARGILDSVPVSILVTDIEMPQESGIDLLKWTKDRNMNIVTIFCTGYADFNYAKKAVELQCFDYYLKPVTFTDFESIIRRAVDKVKEECRNQEYYQYGEYWLDDRKNRKESFWGSVLLNINAPDTEYLMEEAERRRLEYLVEDCFDLLLLSVCSAGEAFRALTRTMNEFVVKNTVEEILRRNEIDMEATVKYGEDTFIIISKSKENADWDRLMEELPGDFEVYLKCRINVFYHRNCPLQDIRTAYEKLEHNWSDKLFSPNGVNKSSTIIASIKEYINQHYSEEITRNDLAENVYLNPDYMSRLFKKEEGCSVTDYVIKVRMQKASGLLIQTDRSINEIALDCGYDNFAYFSRIFKKTTGYAPKEYRNRKLVPVSHP